MSYFTNEEWVVDSTNDVAILIFLLGKSMVNELHVFLVVRLELSFLAQFFIPPNYCNLHLNLTSTRKVITFAWCAAKITPSFCLWCGLQAKYRLACGTVCGTKSICSAEVRRIRTNRPCLLMFLVVLLLLHIEIFAVQLSILTSAR